MNQNNISGENYIYIHIFIIVGLCIFWSTPFGGFLPIFPPVKRNVKIVFLHIHQQSGFGLSRTLR